ncbi:MAG: DUF167 domain-containing protein [Gammaproteobacteria bacterium]|nr:DUF167 domain-containing protein [Gammaproteobacteria bacterium]
MTATGGYSLRGADLVLHLRVQPRAGREGCTGAHAGRLRFRVRAPPVDGAANARLIALLAEMLGLPRASFAIARGTASRDKDVIVAGAAAHAERLIATLTRQTL